MDAGNYEKAVLTRQIIRSNLMTDEKILWSGQQDPDVHFTSRDIFLVPFSLLWGGFAIFWEVSVIVLTILGDDTPGAIGVVFSLFGIPLVIAGLYLMFGRFIYKSWKNKRTYYAVTNWWAICLIRGFRETFREARINSLTTISKSIRKNGTGTITFGYPDSGLFSFGRGLYANTGLDFFSPQDNQLRFFDIKDAEKVYQIVQSVKSG